ncbi:MAG: LTA synthase family protein [Lachnospiraceae bacterium]|nr:LTA synthase family protein [Lachnospiraceae bacterium]
MLKFEIKRAAAAILLTAAMFIITGAAIAGEGMNLPYSVAAAILSIGAGFFLYCKFTYGRIVSALFYLILPAVSFGALENYTHVLSDLKPSIIALNLLFFYLLYAAASFLFGSIRWGFLAATLVPMFFGLANYFVVSFRSSPIVPWDFLSLGTAASVADNYTFTITWKTAFVLFVFIWVILLGSKSRVRFGKLRVRLACSAISVFMLGAYITGIQKSGVQSFFGMDTTLFTLNVLYRNNGIAAAFLGNLRFLNIEEPDGYSPKRAQEIADAALETEEEDGTSAAADSQESAKLPHIIAIMDEAFSDLSVWGDFQTSEEVMPFFKAMQQECVGGEVYVSVKGGNTANTEFEFLTGNTMAFLPTGSVPYQQYINDEMPSLASYLKNFGYTATAIHPYNASGWDRDQVYEYFGFDEFLSLKDFYEPHQMRGYVSDRAAFDKIIEEFEETKAEGGRSFIFEVTMQNHGGYSKPSPDFDSYLKLENVSPKTTSVQATEKYLTLMNETDRALQELLLYFEEQEEPVIVLMFGDHQPSDYITNVVQRISGVQQEDTLDYVQLGYRVPFLVWSNYGLEHTYYDGISVNYLGGILMEYAGLPLTGYQTYLKGLMEQLPVITGNVYRGTDGTFHSRTENVYTDILDEYKILQYNYLVDKENRMDAFFGGKS